jgi:hypothetical protein
VTERSNEEVIADLLARAKPLVIEVPVCTAGDLVTRHAQLMGELLAQGKGAKSIAGDPDTTALLDQIEAVEAEQEASTLVLAVRSIGRRAWADVLREHPPRPVDKGLDHNPDTFPIAAVAAATGTPVETVDALAESLPPGEWRKLWDATVMANVAEMPHPKVPAGITALVRPNGASSTTPPPKASRGRRSSGVNGNQ